MIDDKSINLSCPHMFGVKNRYFLGSILGNVCEWYDYVVYGSLAPILAIVFFPKNNQAIGLILTFTIFAAGFIARPLGGIIFGYVGDTYGRKTAFISSMVVMTLPAVGIALLPGFNVIGEFAPLLLLVFRVLQGVAIGGEYPSIVAYVNELTVPEKRGVIGSFISMTTVIGVLCAIFSITVITKSFSHKYLVSYGWRIPFILTATTIMVGYYLRARIPESKIFSERSSLNNFSFWKAIKFSKLEIVKIFLYTICIAIAYYTFNIFSVSYFTSVLNFKYSVALEISGLGTFMLIVFLPLIGYLSDIYGRKKITAVAILCLIIFIYPIYVAFNQKQVWLLFTGQIGFALIIALYLAPLPAMLAEQVVARVRCTSIAIGYNFALAIFGGTAPIANTYFIKYFGSNLAPSVYLIITGLISLMALYFMIDLTGEALP